MIRPVDIEHRQRVSTPFTEFDVGYSEHFIDTVEFDEDTVDFCFQAQMLTDKLRCHVKLFDAETQAELLNGQAEIVIEENNSDRVFLSFSGFGYLDEQMTERIRTCQYEVWLEGDARVRATLYV
jgi:hypothetical protein